MGRWLSAVLIVPLFVVSVLAVIVVRSQNAKYNDVVALTEVASLATDINRADQALGAEALAGRRVIDEPSLWDDFYVLNVAQTDAALDNLVDRLDVASDPVLENAITITNGVLQYREDMRVGTVSPLQLADRYSVPRTELLDVLRDHEEQIVLRRLVALIEARSAHLDERFSTELALTYGTWAPGQYNTATGAQAIQADRIRTSDDGSAPDFTFGQTQLADFRELIQLSPSVPEITTADFAAASDRWLGQLNAEIDREALRITTELDAQAAEALRARWYTIAGVVVGVLLAFMTAGLISYRIVGRVRLIAEFAKRFGNEREMQGQLSTVVTGRDELADLAVVLDEMTDEVRKSGQLLIKQAQIDELTGILNRRAVISRWNQLLEREGCESFAFAIDLDGFKAINDRLGHHAGDRVLVAVANRLRKAVEGHRAVVGRTGGDEFLAIFDLPDGSTEDPQSIAEQMLRLVRQPIDLDEATVSVDSTIGIVRSRNDGVTAAQLLRDADAALYVAKASGRARVMESDEDLREELAAADALQLAVVEALKNDEFVPWFQGIWNAADELVGFEALARWQAPDGVRGTGAFIEALEDQQMIHLLDGRILRAVCATIAEWSELAQSAPSISVNISTAFLEQYDFLTIVQDLLDEFGFEPSCLVLEVTESGLMTDAASNADRLQKLRDLGVGVSVDDYGTGYSSLSYLRQLPIDYVKLERQFVSNVDTNPKNQAIARSVIALTTDLGMRSVVEGVEREAEKAWLIDNGADLLQGYLFGRPVDAVQAFELLKQNEISRGAA